MKDNYIITDNAREMYPLDNEFIEETLTKVTPDEKGYEFGTESGDFWCPKQNTDFIPEVGMKIRQFCKGHGYQIRGVSINDNLFFYRTAEEADQDHKDCIIEKENKAKEQFEKDRAGLDAIYNALPPVFQKRLDKFRTNNPDFRWKYEGYELFCIKDAVKIAEKLRSVDAIIAWRDMPWDAQRKIVNINEGHSGNTFSCAVHLAKLYITNPDDVVKEHGALCPLVGCNDYGCIKNAPWSTTSFTIDFD